MKLIDLGYPRGKFCEVAADALGWICALQNEADGDLVFLQLHPDGARRTHDVRLAAGGGNAFPVLYVSPETNETWLAWRHETIGGLLLNVSTSRQWSLGDVHGNYPIGLGVGLVWYQSSPAYELTGRSLLDPDGRVETTSVRGRPTGIAWIDAHHATPVLVDDVRRSVAGMVNPQRTSRCTVGENADAGPDRNIARLDDGREAILWSGVASNTPRIATDGRAFASSTWGGPGARLALLTDPPDFRTVVVTPPPIPEPPDPPTPPVPDPPNDTHPMALPNQAEVKNFFARLHIEGYMGELQRRGGVFESPIPRDQSLVKDEREGATAVIDDAFVVWFAEYLKFYQSMGHDLACRAVFAVLHYSDEAKRKRGEVVGNPQ